MPDEARQEGGEELRSPVWLSRYGVALRPVRGELELIGDKLRFTAMHAHPGPASWLEQKAGRPGIAESLAKGELVVALEVPISEAKVRFPPSQMSSVVFITAGGSKWRFSFWNHARTGQDPLGLPKGMASQLQGRKVGTAWRKSLKG